MTIKTNVAANSVLITTADTVLLNSGADERKAISFASLHEQTGQAETVELFLSATAVSAATDRIGKVSFSPNNTKDPLSMHLVVEAGKFLIAKGSNGSRVKSNISYTLYDGGD